VQILRVGIRVSLEGGVWRIAQDEMSVDGNVKGRSFAIISDGDFYYHPLASRYFGWLIRVFSRLPVDDDDKWSLVYLKLLFTDIDSVMGGLYRLSGQTPLPSGESGVNYDSQHGDYRDDKISIFLGSVLFALGIVLIVNASWRVYFKLSSDSNVTAYVAFVIVAAAMIVTGMLFVLCHIKCASTI
jgi:hypothetical protein